MIDVNTICRSQSSGGSAHQPWQCDETCRPGGDCALDRLHLEFPFAGRRKLQGSLSADGARSSSSCRNADARMEIEALYRRRATTKPAGHKIYPYLSRGMQITRPNQAAAMDITYIPMARLRLSGCRARLVQPSRAVVASPRSRWKRHSASRRWRILGSSRRAGGSQYGPGSHSTARHSRRASSETKSPSAWTERGSAGQRFVERLWRSIKYEEGYLRAYDSVA